MKPGQLITFILALSLLATTLPAQQLQWENYTSKNTITSMKSSAGYVWATSTGGVIRIDPDDNSVVTYMNSDGLGSNLINFSAYVGDSVVFFGSADGMLSRLDLKSNEFSAQLLEGRDGAAISLNGADAADNILWIASSVGVIKYDLLRHGGEVKETYRNLGAFPAETEVNDVAVLAGTIYAGTARGIAIAAAASEFLLDPNEWTNDSLRFDSDARISVNCFETLDQKLYVGSTEGVLSSNLEGGWELLTASSGNVLSLERREPDGDLIAVVVSDGTRELWIGPPGALLGHSLSSAIRQKLTCALSFAGYYFGTDGLGVYSAGESASPASQISVPGPASNDLIGGGYTADGNLHVATRRNGVSVLDGDTWQTTTITGSEVLSALVDDNDNLWLTTFGDGVWRVDPNGINLHFGPENSPLVGIQQDPDFSVINSISVDPSGRIWFSLFQGDPHRPMVVFDQSDSLWTWFDTADDLIGGNNQVIAAGAGTAAIGVDDQGIAFLRYGANLFNHSDDRLGYFSRSRRLPSSIVTAVAYDRDNRLWVGTNQGLARFDDDIEFFIPIALPVEVGSDITALVSDSRNNLWVGTTSGLAMVPFGGRDTLALTTLNSDLVSDQIENLVVDSETGKLLIFTANGLSVLDYSTGHNNGTSGVVAYPNPFVIGDGSATALQFVLDLRGDVRIFTIAGDLVRTTDVNTGWDGRNGSGEFVASGVYIWEINAEDGNRHQGKVFVLRR